MNATLVYLVILAYVVLGVVVAFYSKRGTNKEDSTMIGFFLGNRKISGFVNALTFSATLFSAFMMVGLAGLVYAGGVGAIGFELLFVSGLFMVTFFGPRFWVAARERGYVSPSEMLGDRYQSRSVAVITAIVSMIFLIPYTSVQQLGLGYLLSGITKGAIPFWLGVVLTTVLAIFWARIAGLKSVAWTDALQSLIMIVSAVLILLAIIYGAFGGFGGLFTKLETNYPKWLAVPGPGYFKFSTFIGLTLPWFFNSVTNPQLNQRYFVPKSLGGMRKMIVGFLIFALIYTIVAGLWGFSARALFPNLAKADLATPTLLASEFISPVLALIVMIGIMAAAVSTVDSILLTLSSMFARDFYGNIRKGASDQAQLRIGKWIIPIISILTMLFAFLKLDLIVKVAVMSAAGLVILFPAFYGVFFWKRGTAAGVITSVLGTGILVVILQSFNYKPLGIWPGIWAIIVSFVLFFVVSLLTSPPTDASEYVDRINIGLRKEGAI